MAKHNQNGAVSGLVLLLVISVLFLIAAITFGAWAYHSQLIYKNNVDEKVSAAVAVAKQQQIATDSAQFATEEKSPLQVFNGPEAYGSIVLNYPKTWSGYVDTTGNGSGLIDGYFFPGIVPSISASSSVFALRVQVQNQPYSSEAQSIVSQQQNGTITVQAYALPKVPNVIGMKVVGQLADGKMGTEVLLPLRNETLLLWTDGKQYVGDFNTYILPNFSFSP